MAHLYLVQLCRIGVIQDIDPEAEPSDRRNIDPALRLVILNVLSAFFKVSTMQKLSIVGCCFFAKDKICISSADKLKIIK